MINIVLGVPDAPSIPTVTETSQGFISLSWQVPKSNGGSDILGYEVEMKDRNSILWQNVANTPSLSNINLIYLP